MMSCFSFIQECSLDQKMVSKSSLLASQDFYANHRSICEWRNIVLMKGHDLSVMSCDCLRAREKPLPGLDGFEECKLKISELHQREEGLQTGMGLCSMSDMVPDIFIMWNQV